MLVINIFAEIFHRIGRTSQRVLAPSGAPQENTEMQPRSKPSKTSRIKSDGLIEY